MDNTERNRLAIAHQRFMRQLREISPQIADPTASTVITNLTNIVRFYQNQLIECYKAAGADLECSSEYMMPLYASQAVADLRGDYDAAVGTLFSATVRVQRAVASMKQPVR